MQQYPLCIIFRKDHNQVRVNLSQIVTESPNEAYSLLQEFPALFIEQNDQFIVNGAQPRELRTSQQNWPREILLKKE